MTACSDASKLDPKDPIDRDYVKGQLDLLFGGIPSEIPTDVLDKTIEHCIEKFGDSAIFTCDVIFCSLMSLLKYLIRKSWTDEGGESKGELKRRRETEGNVTLEEEYAVKDSSSKDASGWEKLYEYFLKNPDEICECLKPEKNTFGLIKIGGTDANEVEQNESDGSLNTMWDTRPIGNRFSTMRERKRRRSNERSKRWRY